MLECGWTGVPVHTKSRASVCVYVVQIPIDVMITSTWTPPIHDVTSMEPRLRHTARIAALALHPLDERRWVEVAAERRPSNANRQAYG